jgi:hypothetical protein
LSKYVVTGNTVTFNSVDISGSVARAELVVSAASVDVTDFASGGFVELVGGLKSGTVSLDFHSDYGAGGLSQTITDDLVGTIGTVTIIAGNGTAASTATPLFSATCLIESVTPVSGAVGDLSTWSVSWPTTGEITKSES